MRSSRILNILTQNLFPSPHTMSSMFPNLNLSISTTSQLTVQISLSLFLSSSTGYCKNTDRFLKVEIKTKSSSKLSNSELCLIREKPFIILFIIKFNFSCVSTLSPPYPSKSRKKHVFFVNQSKPTSSV